MSYRVLYRPKVPPKDKPWKIHDSNKKEKIVDSFITKADARASMLARFIEEYKDK